MAKSILGGGFSYQLPEALLNKPYNRSVDLYLFGILAYEMMTGVPAFPYCNDEELHKQKIINCKFSYPGDPDCIIKKPLLSKDAKKLIDGLIKPESS